MRRDINRLGFLSKSILLLNAFVIIALLFSYGASFVDPTKVAFLAFFGLGYLPIFLLNLAFVVFWLFRKPKYALASICAMVIGIGLMNKHFTFSKQDVVDRDSVLRVMSYNVHLFREDEHKGVVDSVVQLIRAVEPDVLCMQEFESAMVGKKRLTDEIKTACNFKDHYFYPSNKNKYHGYGHIIFSKYPIVNSGVMNHYSHGINRVIYSDIIKDNDTIRVFNVHLRSFLLQTEDKVFIKNLSADSDEEKKATRRVGRKLNDAFFYRSKQVASLLELFEATPYPKIVMGDFNDTPMSYSVNVLSKGMNNAFQRKGNGWGVTHYEIFPILQIDYILSDFGVANYNVVKKKFSDHYPIWSDLYL